MVAATLVGGFDPWNLPPEAILPFDLDHRFAVGLGWGDHPDVLPDGWTLGQVAGVATHPDGEVYVFQRGRHADPLLVFDQDGRFLRSFGRGLIRVAHSVRVDPDGHLWLVDQEAHQVHRVTRTGERLLTLGRRDVAGAAPGLFDQPTDVAFGPDGRIYVADGYGNSRVVVYAADGAPIGEWGRFGTAPGEFDTPHAIATDAAGLVYVADRSNERIQVFDADGGWLTEWRGVGAVSGITITPDDECWIVTMQVIVGNGIRRGAGCRVLRLDLTTGAVIGGFEAIAGHMVAPGAWGHVYVAALSGNVLHWTPWSERTEEVR